MKKTTVLLDPKFHAALKELSKRTGAPVSFLINKAIQNYLKLRAAS